jgi:mRNA interferase RelE/StbE
LYETVLKRKASKAIARLPESVHGRVTRAIDNLSEDPSPRGSRELHGREGRRLRVGEYRVVHEIDDDGQVVTILQVGHRRDVYRQG